jgi:hypothetical protein
MANIFSDINMYPNRNSGCSIEINETGTTLRYKPGLITGTQMMLNMCGYIYMYTHVYMYEFRYIYIYMYTYVYIYIYIYIYTYVYIQTIYVCV